VSETCDVVVVGGGPGGYAACLYGAAAGLKTMMVTVEAPGGTCLLRGCIPAKELLQTAEVYRQVRHAGEFGIRTEEPIIDWKAAVLRQGNVVDQLVGGLSSLLKKRKVEVIQGYGRVLSSGVVEVARPSGAVENVEADAVLLAAGSAPCTIPGFEIDGERIVTSDQALFFDELPQRIVVIGGGVIGCEFATTFVDLGVEVTLLEAMDTLIPGADPDIVQVLRRELRKRGVDIRLGATVSGHSVDASGATTVAFTHEEKQQTVEVDKVILAVGRKPATAPMRLPEAGITIDDRGFVEVDVQNMRTSREGVWAVGDCVPTPALAHIAYAEAMVAIRDILGEDPRPIDYTGVPWCVYTHPELAFVGLTEQQAKDAGHDVAVAKHRYAGVGRAMIIGETAGLVKIVSDRQTGVILGVHLCGPLATEQLLEGYLSVNWEATVGDLGSLIHPHPTFGEAIGEAAMTLMGRGLHG